MKNIVLVTWIGGGNYGTSLQSFALHRKLELLGYNVSFLLKFPDRFRFKDNVKCILCKLGIDMNIIKKLTLYPNNSNFRCRANDCRDVP